MKYLRYAVCVLSLFAVRMYAQQDLEEEVDDFKPTLDDDMILYTRKFAFKLGFREITGAKGGFAGTGQVLSAHDIGDASELGTIMARSYHDGYVFQDLRVETDPSGRTKYITPDGKTNTWGYSSDSQASINGLMQLSTYQADVSGYSREKNPKGSLGVDLTIEREVGALFNGKIKWGVLAGASINGLSATASNSVTATVIKVTDYYSTYGQTVPEAPYASSSTTGSEVLLGQTPLGRETTVSTTTSQFTTFSRIRGSYLTFRAGPTLFVPVTESFSATIAAGLALAYTGTTYMVTEEFVPGTGDTIVDTIQDGQSNFLPGFFVDANVQYAITETAGLYLGAVYQNNGSFDQTIADTLDDSKYTAHVDLSKLQGIRAGVSFKF